MANVIYLKEISSAFQDELRGGFALQAVDQKYEGMSFFIWPKRSSTCVSFQFGLGYSATTRSKSCERSRSANCLGVTTTSELTVNRTLLSSCKQRSTSVGER